MRAHSGCCNYGIQKLCHHVSFVSLYACFFALSACTQMALIQQNFCQRQCYSPAHPILDEVCQWMSRSQASSRSVRRFRAHREDPWASRTGSRQKRSDLTTRIGFAILLLMALRLAGASLQALLSVHRELPPL